LDGYTLSRIPYGIKREKKDGYVNKIKVYHFAIGGESMRDLEIPYGNKLLQEIYYYAEQPSLLFVIFCYSRLTSEKV
jgi:hypothetical protein